MFILGKISNILDDLAQFRYGHNLVVDYVVGSVCDHVSLFIEPPFLIMKVDDYVLLNELEELKDNMDPFQVCRNKCASNTNYAVGNISCLES